MANDTKFIDLLERRIKLSIRTQAPARVISFDEGKQTADVELLFLSVDTDGDADKYPVLQDVPILGMRYKISHPIPANIAGLTGAYGGVDGSNGIIHTKQEIEFKPFLKKNDVVFVEFAERALDHLNGTTPFDPEFNRTHDQRDAVITGILNFAP